MCLKLNKMETWSFNSTSGNSLPLTTVAPVQYQVSPCDICGSQSSTKQVFRRVCRTTFSVCLYEYSVFIHYSFFHLSLMLYNLNNTQRSLIRYLPNMKTNWRIDIWLYEFLISVPKEWQSSALRLVSFTSLETFRCFIVQ